jgi:hypothetical protein
MVSIKMTRIKLCIYSNKLVFEREEERRRNNEVRRLNYARRRAELPLQELELENRDRITRQRTSDEVSHFETQGRHEVDFESSERYNQALPAFVEMSHQNENSRTIERVPETPHPASQNMINLGGQGNRENIQNPTEFLQDNFYTFQMQFRQQLDSLRMPHMCYICQECYLRMKVFRTSEGLVCNRCRQEKGKNRFSTLNNMDPGPQPEELANLTQVEEMLIARVSPILQVTHATGGQYKYKGHTISFPQNIEHVSNILPHTIDNLPIIIVRRRDQRGTNYNFTVNRDRVYKALKYKVEHDKFYSDVQINENALNDLPRNADENIFARLKTINMEFDSDANEIVFVGPVMESDEGNIIDHTTSMASRPPNAQKEMELIRAWVNNPDVNPTSLIDWPTIGVSPINEYVTLGLLDMAFPTLFPDGSCDWLEPRLWQVYLHEFVKHLMRYRDHRFGITIMKSRSHII